MLRIKLPYPDRSLNPNVRRVWQASLKPKKEARETGYYAAREASCPDFLDGYCEVTCQGFLDADKPIRLRIAIHPPDNGRRDWMNVVSAVKNYEDGIMDYIGRDDSEIKHIDIRWRRSCPGGKVNYILYQK